MTELDPLAKLLQDHGGMSYGPGSPIRCYCRKILKGEIGKRYELFAEHQAGVVRAFLEANK